MIVAKKVQMQSVSNEDGESDVRAQMQSVPEDAPPVESKDEATHRRLDDLLKFISGKKDDALVRDYKLHIVQTSLIQELGEKKAKSKAIHFSDGLHEMLKLQHNRLSKYFK